MICPTCDHPSSSSGNEYDCACGCHEVWDSWDDAMKQRWIERVENKRLTTES